MIENQEIAKQISDLMLEYGARLNASVALVKENCSEDELNAYRLAAGRVLGEMLLEIMNPIYTQHPQLKPEGLYVA